MLGAADAGKEALKKIKDVFNENSKCMWQVGKTAPSQGQGTYYLHNISCNRKIKIYLGKDIKEIEQYKYCPCCGKEMQKV